MWVVIEGPDCGVSINLDPVWVDILLFYQVGVSRHVYFWLILFVPREQIDLIQAKEAFGCI